MTTQLQLIHIIIIIIIIIIDLNGSGYMAREQESICYGVLCWTDGEEVDSLFERASSSWKNVECQLHATT